MATAAARIWWYCAASVASVVAQRPVERDRPGMRVDPVLVRVLAIEWAGREVQHDRLPLAPVLVAVPDAWWDQQQRSRVLGEVKLRELLICRRFLSAVEEDHANAAGGKEIPVRLLPVHSPSLDASRAYREAVRVDDWLVPEVIVEVDDLGETAAIVDLRHQSNVFDHLRFRPIGGDRLVTTVGRSLSATGLTWWARLYCWRYSPRGSGSTRSSQPAYYRRMRPVATILVPTHNHGATLPLAVSSALRQTEAAIEVIIIGDGVDGATREAAGDLSNADSRVRFIERPKRPAMERRTATRF